MTREEIKKMLSIIEKHTNEIITKSKYKDNITLANCVIALSGIIREIYKI